MTTELRIDALLPPEMAERAEILGVKKAEMQFLTMFALAVLAGAFIALGAIFATTVAAGSVSIKTVDGAIAFTSGIPYGVTRLLMGLVFCLGLILVIVGGAELFTGNNLIVMAWAGRKVSTYGLLRNWTIVYIGNFVGALGTAVLMFFARQYSFGDGAMARTVLTIANSKVHLGFIQAIALGILCNALVCLAVWMCYSARSTTDRIMAIIFPIAAFVAAGFEHSIANMYFISIGLLIKDFDPAAAAKAAEAAALNLDGLTWGTFLFNNLLPVTIGNIIGGSVLVAAVYWIVFLRRKTSVVSPAGDADRRKKQESMP